MRQSSRVLGRVWNGEAIRGQAEGLLSRIGGHARETVAVRDARGVQTYGEVCDDMRRVSGGLRAMGLGRSDGVGARVGILHDRERTWIHAVLGTWNAGCVAVPLSGTYPKDALLPLLEDSGAEVVLTDSRLAGRVPKGVRAVLTDELIDESCDDDGGSEVTMDEARMLLFTSGTTGRSKGVVWSERMIRTQLYILNRAWRWSALDAALGVLPLHHVHGVVNVCLSALYAGARLDLHTRFDAAAVWDALQRDDAANVVMGVPTVYRALLDEYDDCDESTRKLMREAARRVRLFVCGSASLAAVDAKRWRDIVGETPLERYGMTETGMTLSNHYDRRQSGALGAPLPGVSARLSSDNELIVRGDAVFRRYWGRDDATAAAFDQHGWFRTGDVVRWDEERGVFVMVGRASSDIMKSGGYKISALEIEGRLREIDEVADAAVFGVSCARLGERVTAAVVPSGRLPQQHMECDQLVGVVLEKLSGMLPRYKVPREVVILEKLPRNAMGKIQKKILKQQWQGNDARSSV